MKLSHLCLASLIVFTTACKREREEIRTYKVAKESATPQQPAGMPDGTKPGEDPHAGIPGMTPGATGADPHAGLTADQLAAAGAGMPTTSEFTDTPPAHWKKLPLTPMLLVKYQIQGEGGATVDVTFSTLRSAPGGLLANINRWRGQLDQAPIDEATLKQTLKIIPSGFGDAAFVEIEGLAPNGDATKDGRLIGAIAEVGPSAWFFKMRGNSALTATEKDHFLKWVTTVRPAAPATPDAPSAIPMHGTPPGAPTAPVPATGIIPAAPAGDGSVTWQLPAGWTIANGSSARYATIAVSGADGTKGELAISHFPGDVGGDLANVNRWRQQVSLPPIDEAAMTPTIGKVTSGPKTISLIDATGPQVRCAAGWVRHGADTWFFKFTGPDALVGAEKAKFTAFLESVRFTKPE